MRKAEELSDRCGKGAGHAQKGKKQPTHLKCCQRLADLAAAPSVDDIKCRIYEDHVDELGGHQAAQVGQGTQPLRKGTPSQADAVGQDVKAEYSNQQRPPMPGSLCQELCLLACAWALVETEDAQLSEKGGCPTARPLCSSMHSF